MSVSPLSLIKTGMMQSGGGGGSSYTEQGVTADGTQRLDLGALAGADTPSSVFFASFDVSVNGRNVLTHYSATNSSGHYAVDNNTGDTSLDPTAKFETSGAGLEVHTTPTQAYGRVHWLVSSERESTNDLRLRYAVWSSALGWQTGNRLVSAGGDVEFTTGGANVSLLAKQNNTANIDGDIYRVALWRGTTIDVELTSTQNLFTSGGATIDPATSVASLGSTNLVFDAFGNAATWNSGDFSTNGKGVFTKTGNAFLDV